MINLSVVFFKGIIKANASLPVNNIEVTLKYFVLIAATKFSAVTDFFARYYPLSFITIY